MIINFTDTEKEWIVKEPMNWHVKDGCPEQLKAIIISKLELLYADDDPIKKAMHRR